jgi:hypothetical protein
MRAVVPVGSPAGRHQDVEQVTGADQVQSDGELGERVGENAPVLRFESGVDEDVYCGAVHGEATSS